MRRWVLLLLRLLLLAMLLLRLLRRRRPTGRQLLPLLLLPLLLLSLEAPLVRHLARPAGLLQGPEHLAGLLAAARLA